MILIWGMAVPLSAVVVLLLFKLLVSCSRTREKRLKRSMTG